MSDVVAKCDNEKITKVKVASAEIIVSGKADKPYYEIKYYDLSKNEWCIGYSSYELKFVFQWLNECFELAKEPHECNSDLISKNKLIEDLNRINSEYYPSAQVSRLMECVNNQPQILVQDSPKLVQESDCISRKLLLQELETDTEDKFGKEWFKYMVNNQPQVQSIVRTPEEVTEMLNKISCTECDKNSSHCHFSESDCKNYWYEWLTKKEV